MVVNQRCIVGRGSKRKEVQEKKKNIVFSALFLLGEIPIDNVFIMLVLCGKGWKFESRAGSLPLGAPDILDSHLERVLVRRHRIR